MLQDDATRDADTQELPAVPPPPVPWVALTRPGRGVSAPQVRPRRVVVQVVAAAAAVIVLVSLLGAVAARRLAEREAVNDAAQRADLVASAVLQPVLTDGLLTGDPAAFAAVDQLVDDRVIGESIVRVKIWTPEGRILYSDEPRLVGEQFPLGADEREVLADPQVRAEISDLDEPENRFERGRGRLLEVYRPVVTTPSGAVLLFETYSPYDEVTQRSAQLWRGFAGLVTSSLLLLVALLVPVLWRLLDGLRSGQVHREALLRRAVDASQAERRRIAGTLHDGVVQELAATSFTLAGSVERAEREGSAALAGQLREAAATVRSSIGGLRSLLVDIYPPSLSTGGLVVALTDLVGPLRRRQIDVELDLPADSEPLDLSPDAERLVFRIARECLSNVAKHAAASTVRVTLGRQGSEVVLEVDDDGVGFDPASTAARAEGHFGLHVLHDLAEQAGAALAVASAPGRGTRWRLRVPS